VDAATIPGPLAVSDQEAIGDLRAALWSAGYSAERLRELLGFGGDSVVVPPGEVPGVDRRLPRGEPLSTLVRLFLLAIPVPLDEVTGALGNLTPERCAALGVIEVADHSARAACRLIPVRDLIVAVSREHEFSAELEPDHVMGITPSTDMLANLTPRSPATCSTSAAGRAFTPSSARGTAGASSPAT
jgi:hypothetical protein